MTEHEFTRRVADGECPNSNCDKGGDVEEISQDFSDFGDLSIVYKCDCGTVWKLNFSVTECIVQQKPKGYKQIQ